MSFGLRNTPEWMKELKKGEYRFGTRHCINKKGAPPSTVPISVSDKEGKFLAYTRFPMSAAIVEPTATEWEHWFGD